ncbi:TrkH family potassium uptake protein [Arthrobacter crystallopoietes BAB-32]|uniref:TrkH family potassium uptake protein n=1 Tax=Arthrobacter crystallopoietes BAB-32 TaxID=1246476 RepID=N1V515_9MICC|nr:potassium transporter TrkG [Arthrobacter crystallopoietes]EMY35114.1 TrkH family potassium uptake protein [Arthrobacter crystallopoietes BAB-32]
MAAKATLARRLQPLARTLVPLAEVPHAAVVLAQRVRPRHPAQVIALGFVGAILAGTAVLMLPAAKQGAGGATFLEALFTATSSVCVTGLIIVDTPVFWTPFGQVVIMVLIQLGGFGVMSFGALLGVLMAGRLGLRARVSAAAETKSPGFGDVRGVLLGVLKISLLTEAALALVLMLRFILGYGYAPGEALWQGVFHAVSSFNNAGFALYSDNLMGFVSDPWICLPIAAAVIIGGLGFPVLFELARRYRRPIHWSMNTKLVLSGTAVLLVGGTVFLTAVEWTNRATLGALDPGSRLLAGFFQSVITRTAGFNSIDIGQMNPVSWLGMDIMMFIGGGPAGTAGGLKITTFAVLYFILYTEVRGEAAVNIFGKRLSRSVHRQAITVVLLALALVVASTMALMFMSDAGMERLLFEAISAFATVGLSTGITASLPPAGQVILIVLMFVGRLGPVTLASALALRARPILYEFPKERPLIG